jgi:heptose I phosphotransferase
MLNLAETFRTAWKGKDIYDLLFKLEGQVYREKEGRRTFRFEMGGQSYFAKVFMGIGWRALLSCLLKFRKPIISAENEWRAIKKLEQLGIDTMHLVGHGKRGYNPAKMQSFIITEELKPTISLEDFCRDWKQHPPPIKLKRALITMVARIARILHSNGIVHRDLYLCHFLLDTGSEPLKFSNNSPRLYLIDLHRAEQCRKIKRRWCVKDVSGLFFSSMDIGLTQRDRLRFIEAYSQRPWRDAIREEARFWKQVERRGMASYREFRRKNPNLFK